MLGPEARHLYLPLKEASSLNCGFQGHLIAYSSLNVPNETMGSRSKATRDLGKLATRCTFDSANIQVRIPSSSKCQHGPYKYRKSDPALASYCQVQRDRLVQR